MNINFDLSALAKTTWWEVGVRFVFGGATTVVAGLLAKKFGPVFGGLFLVFPAILPASASLVEKHEREKKQRAGITNTIRGRQAAALDARGAAYGAVGLFCFALAIWKLLTRWNVGLAFIVAVAVWFTASVLTWLTAKSLRRRLYGQHQK